MQWQTPVNGRVTHIVLHLARLQVARTCCGTGRQDGPEESRAAGGGNGPRSEGSDREFWDYRVDRVRTNQLSCCLSFNKCQRYVGTWLHSFLPLFSSAVCGQRDNRKQVVVVGRQPVYGKLGTNNVELNDSLGVISGYCQETGRFLVKLSNGTFPLKARNIREARSSAPIWAYK